MSPNSMGRLREKLGKFTTIFTTLALVGMLCQCSYNLAFKALQVLLMTLQKRSSGYRNFTDWFITQVVDLDTCKR